MKKVVLFPGYGSQFVGMAKQLYDESRVVQEYFEEASQCLNINFVKTCFASSEAELSQISVAYPSIFLVSCALYAMIKERGILPDLVTGYGIGFFSALHSSGCVTFPDGLYMLHKYAQLYQEYIDTHDFSALSIKGKDVVELYALCAESSTEGNNVSVAVILNQTNVIVTGDSKAVRELQDKICGKKKVKCRPTTIGVGLHSFLMQSVVEKFVAQLPMVDIGAPKVPCMDNDRVMLINAEQVQAATIKSVTHTIEWYATMQSISEYDMIIQVGPGDRLSTLAKEQYPDKLILTVQTAEEFDQLDKVISHNSLPVETE